MNLPFDTAPKTETHTVGTDHTGKFELPKLYSVTPKEEIAIAESLRKAGSGNDISALNRCKCEIAAIALKRKPKTKEFDPEAVTADLMADHPLELVEALFNYILAERRQWKDPEPQDGQKKSNGANTSSPLRASSPTTTTASAPAGPSDTTAKPSATSRSAKSAKATKPTSNSEL